MGSAWRLQISAPLCFALIHSLSLPPLMSPNFIFYMLGREGMIVSFHTRKARVARMLVRVPGSYRHTGAEFCSSTSHSAVSTAVTEHTEA